MSSRRAAKASVEAGPTPWWQMAIDLGRRVLAPSLRGAGGSQEACRSRCEHTVPLSLAHARNVDEPDRQEKLGRRGGLPRLEEKRTNCLVSWHFLGRGQPSTKRRLRRQRVDHRDLDVRTWPFSEAPRGSRGAQRAAPRSYEPETRSLSDPGTLALAARNS